MNGTLCRDCGKDHQSMRDSYLCDLRLKYARQHVSDCDCDLCRRVMAYEDSLEQQQNERPHD